MPKLNLNEKLVISFIKCIIDNNILKKFILNTYIREITMKVKL